MINNLQLLQMIFDDKALENMEPEMAIEKLQLYQQELLAQKNDAVKSGYYEKAATIRDEEKRIEALIASKAGKTGNRQS